MGGVFKTHWQDPSRDSAHQVYTIKLILDPVGTVECCAFLRSLTFPVKRLGLLDTILPKEDAVGNHKEAIVPFPDGFWSLFAFIENHERSTEEAWYGSKLLPAVVGALADLYSSRLHIPGESTPIPSNEVEKTMSDTFCSLENDVANEPSILLTSTTSPSTASPSGKLVFFYDSHSRQLHVASTAHCLKAILARRMRNVGGSASYSLLPVLSDDHRNVASSQDQSDESLIPASDASVSSAVTPTTASFTIQPGDRLILGTNSLWCNITDAEVTQTIERWEEQGNPRRTESSGVVSNFWLNPLAWFPGLVTPMSPEPPIYGHSADASNAASDLTQSALRHLDEGNATGAPEKCRDIMVLVVTFSEEEGRE
ncbi:hypothetical protein EUX98_g5159 [Antrodiella citrinella]|uniref:PPM-type phosphatase domain-containing protein n=1 Tax=Antrodiella citrinella TaxID=2447956 RepID=A0A4S4MSE6_9APHY|nr:hypothetical protein EUX98_g5159 [Antrodiella citrinella]